MTRNNLNRSSQRVRFSFVKIHTGSDLSRRRLPLMALESSVPGPSVWLTACGHGDEVGGMVIVQELFKLLRKQPLLRGSLYAFPLMNPTGFETASRYIVMSKEDLNRSFPGNKNGSLAERIADKIFNMIIETQPDLVLDLHNDWMKSIPYTLLDQNTKGSSSAVYHRAVAYARQTGFPVVLDTDDSHRSLSFSLLRQDVSALTLEMGESFVVNEMNVKYGVGAILNILSCLDMIEAPGELFQHPASVGQQDQILHYSHVPISSTSGIIRFLVRPGDKLKKGKQIAKIYNAFGKHQETLTAQADGIVLGHSDYSVTFPGAPVMAFGITEERN